jgi:predicted neutral ceramidase superfamily lipid hydrolase
VAEETKQQRVNRELIELLNELRVVLPGVQVLFAFLLTVPFTQRFPNLTQDQRRVYFLAVVATFVSSILLIAPAAHHRLLFRQGSKERVLKTANVLVVAGTAALAVGMSLSLYLIADVLYPGTAAGIASAVAALATAFLWFGVPRILKVPNGDTDDA